jgi:hypothetical protein
MFFCQAKQHPEKRWVQKSNSHRGIKITALEGLRTFDYLVLINISIKCLTTFGNDWFRALVIEVQGNSSLTAWVINAVIVSKTFGRTAFK